MMDTLFGDLAPWFTVPALLGTGFLLIQLVLGQIGADTDAGLDIDIDVDVDIDLQSDHPGAEFGYLSIQTLSAFFMGYGWIGFGAYRFLNLDFTGSALIGVAAGAGVAWLIVTLLRAMLKLQHSGNVHISQAVGLVADVYVTIPPAGQGRGEVVLTINDSRHSYYAIQECEQGQDPGQALSTHTRVRVLRADTAGHILIVEPA